MNPRYEPIPVEITTTVFVDPSIAANAEWRQRITDNQKTLGGIVSEAAGVQVDFSLNGRSEADYEAEFAVQQADSRLCEEIDPSNEILDMALVDSILHLNERSEQSAKLISGILRKKGIHDVRGLLAVGHQALVDGHAGRLSRKSVGILDRAIAAQGISIPKAPSAIDAAYFCDSAAQVPAQVLVRIEASSYRHREEVASGPYPYDERPPYYPNQWEKFDLLEKSVADIAVIPLDTLISLACEVPNNEYLEGTIGWHDTRETRIAAARVLHETAQQYVNSFNSAKASR